MNILQSIRSFIHTAEAGSGAGGARTLGVSRAAVSQNIARLEAHLGVRLLNRTTRSLASTERGALYLEQVRQVELDLERARQSVAGPQAAPEGRLRVASTAAFGRHVLAPLLPLLPALAALAARYPRLSIELLSADQRVASITGKRAWTSASASASNRSCTTAWSRAASPRCRSCSVPRRGTWRVPARRPRRSN